MEELISIIVPVYKVEKYINRCIDSIINQTYKNLEIILVDDGSPDNCGKICDKYAGSDSRIIVIHKENGGLSDARNVAIDIATGKYIAFIDSDDYVDKQYIEYLYNILKKNNAELSICNFKEVYDKKIIEEVEEDFYEKNFTPEEAIETMLYQKEFDHSAWGKLYKKELFDNIRFPKGRIFEDFAIMYELIGNTKSICFGSKRKYFYYIRKDSIMNQKFNIKKMDLIYFSKKMVSFIDNRYPNLSNAARRRDNISNFYILRQLLYCNPRYYNEEKQVIKNIKKNSINVLKNNNAYKKDKLAIMCLFLGKNFFKFVWKKYKKN